jgi:hypothetical protein
MGKAREYHPSKDEANKSKEFNPRAYPPEQVDLIEAAMRLLVNPPQPGEPQAEVIEPASDSG